MLLPALIMNLYIRDRNIFYKSYPLGILQNFIELFYSLNDYNKKTGGN